MDGGSFLAPIPKWFYGGRGCQSEQPTHKQMDGIWIGNISSLHPCSLANHNGQLCIKHSHVFNPLSRQSPSALPTYIQTYHGTHLHYLVTNPFTSQIVTSYPRSLRQKQEVLQHRLPRWNTSILHCVSSNCGVWMKHNGVIMHF